MSIFMPFMVLVMLCLWLASIVWAVRDARRRGKSGFLVAILVIFLTWPLGLIIWLIFRPSGPRRRR